jgi:hypothetical protein
VVRTRSDGTSNNRQPVGAVRSEHTVDVPVEQFTQRNEPVSRYSITVGTWTRAFQFQSDRSFDSTGSKPGYAPDNARPNFTDEPGTSDTRAGAADSGDSVTVCAASRDAAAA